MINSKELVQTINCQREELGLALKNHKNLMRTIRGIISIMGDENFIKTTYVDIQNKTQPSYDITKEGLKQLMDLTRNRDKIPMQIIYEELGGEVSTVVCIDRFEDSFFNKLREVLDVLDITLELQYQCLGYKIDGYIPSLNLAIEYDEEHHIVKGTKALDKKRENEIIKKINCEIIRLNYKDTDWTNIGQVIKAIQKINKKGGI